MSICQIFRHGFWIVQIPRWLETNKVPLRDLHGEIIGILGTYQDISDRKRAEETLAESEAFNRQLVEEFPIGLVSCRLDGHLVFVNTVFAQILGRTVEEILSLKLLHEVVFQLSLY